MNVTSCKLVRNVAPSGDHGFSLIEVLVSTVILLLLVLIMSTIFHQSSVAWDAGTRKAKGNMTGRALLGLMAREIASATSWTNDVSSIQFSSLSSSTNSKHRVVRHVKYSLEGEQISRECTEFDAGGAPITLNPATLTSSAGSLKFENGYPFSPDSGDLVPPYVIITMSLKKSAEVSGVGAHSLGPDGVRQSEGDPKDDDIRSY